MSEKAREAFLAVMRQVQTHAAFLCRHYRNQHDREDFVQEVLGVAWKWTVAMVQRGKDPRDFPAALAARHVRSGRRLAGGKLGRHDALSRSARARHGFTLQPLSPGTCLHEQLYGAVQGQRRQDAMEEVLGEHDRSPVPEQVAFRVDFAAWRGGHNERRRGLLDAMMAGERTRELAEAFAVSPGRISQLRREFESSWRSFTDA